ncbi:MAG: hypothetical protein QF860_00875 [Planctomycetota bacterium]|nr:hypothetical protein [Planctomycetota bacterium]
MIHEHAHQTSQPAVFDGLSAPGGASREPGFLDDPFRVACGARTRKAPPGTELLCLVHVFMNHPG